MPPPADLPPPPQRAGHADPDAELDALVHRTLTRLPRPLDWRRLPPGQAAAERADLADWVRWLTGRYALDHREVPPCWHQHPALVEELSALKTAHTIAFHPTQPGTAPADWHQGFGYTRQRLREWASRTGCKPNAHREDTVPAWTYGLEVDRHHPQLDAFLPGRDDDTGV